MSAYSRVSAFQYGAIWRDTARYIAIYGDMGARPLKFSPEIAVKVRFACGARMGRHRRKGDSSSSSSSSDDDRRERRKASKKAHKADRKRAAAAAVPHETPGWAGVTFRLVDKINSYNDDDSEHRLQWVKMSGKRANDAPASVVDIRTASTTTHIKRELAGIKKRT